ncbi:T9SS type A sorting domain-containing protein [Lutibacter sp.]|uniref:T9SS type A sorting domain-containing protein n=1 Tax=Lutibacter sp. TaxID=1925666 RepID=UPI003563C8C3
MKKLYILFITIFISTLSFGQNVFINEIHYDNISGDTGEGFEIAGPAGLDLTGYKMVLYNGNGNNVLSTISLSGVFTDQLNGYGMIWFASGMQNDLEAMALVNSLDEVVQFLSYEGVITAIDGPAIGMTSTNIGVSESNTTTPVGYSLQLTDAGWVGPTLATLNAPNSDQTLSTTKNQIDGFAMYPNPVANGRFSISSNSNADKFVEIYSLLGKQVYSKNVKASQTIEVSNLSRGVYILRVEEEGKIATRKLVIQ